MAFNGGRVGCERGLGGAGVLPHGGGGEEACGAAARAQHGCGAGVGRWEGYPGVRGRGPLVPHPSPPFPPCRPRRAVAVDARRAGAPPGGPLGPLRVGQHPPAGGGWRAH